MKKENLQGGGPTAIKKNEQGSSSQRAKKNCISLRIKQEMLTFSYRKYKTDVTKEKHLF